MKTTLSLVILLVAIEIDAQNYGNFLGSGPGAFSALQHEPARPQPKEYRKVDGEIKESSHWSVFRQVTIIAIENGGLILQTVQRGNVKNIFVKNASIYGSGYAQGQQVTLSACITGTKETTWGTLEQWDCGIPCGPPPPSKEELAKQKAIENAKISQLKKEQEKIDSAQTKVILILMSESTNGSASAQCSLADHYLNGKGIQQDKVKAIFWLKKAAENGSIEASNKLISIGN